MPNFLNFHTHAADAAFGVTPIRCFEPSALLKDFPLGGALVSVGHHPWQVGPASRLELANLAQMAQHPQVVAIGEIGLDKLCGTDFQIQQEVLLLQLRMAACVQKPVVIHCVKAWDELLLALGRVDGLPPVVVHGFRGKPQQARQLLAKGCWLSIGLKYNEETVCALPAGSFFLETDDAANALLPQLYAQVAHLRSLAVEDLNAQVWNTWECVRRSCGLLH